MQPMYTKLKVNHEMELCEVEDPECRALIERALLKERISYYIYWTKASLLRRRKEACVFCIHNASIDRAEEIVEAICAEHGYKVRFILKRAHNDYL